MANIKSAIKRIDVSKRQTEANKSRKTEIKTIIKKFNIAVDNNDFDTARELLKLIDKKLKRAEAKNIVHKNKVARKMSGLTKRLNNAM